MEVTINITKNEAIELNEILRALIDSKYPTDRQNIVLKDIVESIADQI